MYYSSFASKVAPKERKNTSRGERSVTPANYAPSTILAPKERKNNNTQLLSLSPLQGSCLLVDMCAVVSLRYTTACGLSPFHGLSTVYFYLRNLSYISFAPSG